MSADEMLVSWLLALSDVITLCGSRVFHLENFQNADSQSRYPCVVYRLSDEIPEKELYGNVGYDTYQYDVYTIAKKSADLRGIVEQIKDFGSPDFNTTQFVALQAQGFEAVDVDAETEDNEFAIEQQELGYKVSTLSVSIFYNRGCS